MNRSTGLGIAIALCGAGIVWILAGSPTEWVEEAGPERAVRPEAPVARSAPEGVSDSQEDRDRDAVEPEVADVPPSEAPEPSASEAAMEEFRMKFSDRNTPSVEEMSERDFIFGDHAKLNTMQIVVRNLGLTADQLRALYEEGSEENDLGTWSLLGLAYGKGLDAEDLEWLEGLGTRDPDDPGTEQMAAILAARAASGINRLDESGAMTRITAKLLDGVLEEGEAAESNPALKLALRSVEELGGDLPVQRLEDLALREGTSPELAAQCFEALARTGGADEAQAVVSAYRRGVPGALAGIASLRDPSAIPDLQAWIESARSPDGDLELGSAAVTGLLSTGGDVALETFEELLLADDARTSEEIARWRRIALEGLLALDDPRSLGLKHRIYHLAHTWRYQSEDADLNTLGRAVLQVDEIMPRLALGSWMMPSEKTTGEVAAGLRRAIESIPSSSLAADGLWWYLAHVARPEDIGFIRENAPPRDYENLNLAKYLQQAQERWE